ncbi:MAG: energy transducer TonB, partial [Vicinamibacteraceae bacterium]|nr:energy transducer TonB [Vicinamibacteraceae bacterium]
QRLPGLAAGQIYRGAIEIDIDTNGMVSAVRLVTSIHPVYDVRLLDAARRWRYRPATRKGVAVPYTRVVNVELGPLE